MAWRQTWQQPGTIRPVVAAVVPAAAAWQQAAAVPRVSAASWQAKAVIQQGTAPAYAAAAVAPGLAAASVDTYVVTTKGKDGDEVVIRTLMGEYKESGSNHGRKFFKKGGVVGVGEAVDVFLYYWDSRDGPAFEGWWFGNKLGGTQVWSHCTSAGLTPPSTGWKIPWDGSVRSTLTLTSKVDQQKNDAQSRFKNIGTEVSDSTTVAKSVLDEAKRTAGDYSNSESLKAAEQILNPQLTALAETMKKLNEMQRTTSGEALRQLQGLKNTVQALISSTNVELSKVRTSKAKADTSEKNQASESRDMAIFNEVMPEATAKANAAEDAVEKALITSEMIAAGGDDLDEVRQAVTQTEQAVQEAQKAIGEARIYLNAKQASARRFESEKIKLKAANDLTALQSQLQEAQTKLNPLKTVRQDFVQRTAAQKAVHEILEKLSPAEVDVDRAEEATMLLKSEGPSKEMMQQAEQAMNKAGEHLNAVMRFIEQKKKTAVGLAKDEVVKMEDRARASLMRLGELKNSQKEATERVGLEVLLKEAADKLAIVATTVSKAADCEGPWLMGVETLPLEESLAAVKACETAAQSANTAASIARMFIATKLVEAKRFTPELSKEAQEKLKEFQAELNTHTKRLTELKKVNAERKRASTMQEAEHEVKKAEELAAKVKEAAAPLQDDEKLLTLSSEEIRAASTATIKAEQEASKHLIETRKFLTARQIEAKGRADTSTEESTELIKYETRLRAAQTEIGQYKRLTTTVETRLQAKKVIEDCGQKVKDVEEKLEKLVQLTEALDKPENPSDDKVKGLASKAAKAAEQAASEAQVALKSTNRFIELQLRIQTGSSKVEIEKMQPRMIELQESLDSAVATMQAKAESQAVETISAESQGRLKEAEDSINRLKDAEKPFLEGAEELAAEKVSETLQELESSVQAAVTAVSGAKTFVGVKKLAARRLSEASKKSAEEQLQAVVAKLDELAKSLSETKKNMAERKQAIVKREVVAKVEETAKKVEASEEATAALLSLGKPKEAKVEATPEGEGSAEGEQVADDSGPPPADEMKSACEKAGSRQQEARASITETQKLLLARQKEAKVSSTSESAFLLEITKSLERLTQMLATLDKQKLTLRDQEHRFVAQRLLKDATDQIANLEKKLEEAAEKASPLTADDAQGMSALLFLMNAIDMLKQHLQKASKAPKDLFAELSAGKGFVEEGAFVSKLLALSQEAGPEDTQLSEEQLKAAFKRLAGKEDGQVAENAFVEEFRSRFLCTSVVTMTDALVIKGGKTIRKVEVQEVVESLGEPAKEEALGLMRLKIKAEKDEKEGYVTLAGNQGTVYFEPYSPYNAFQKATELELKSIAEATKDAIKYLDTKVEELKSVKSGPLSDTKLQLMKLKPRVIKVQTGYNDIRKKVALAEKKHSQAMDEEKKRRLEAADKKAASVIVEEVTKLVVEAEEAAGKVTPGAEGLIASLGGDQDSPLAAMDSSEKEVVAVQESLANAMTKIKEQMDSIKGQTAKGPYTEARNSLVKLKVKVGALENKCKKLVQGLRTARKDMAIEAQDALLSAFRSHAMTQGITADALFKQLCPEGSQEIPVKVLRNYLEKIPDSQLKANQIDMGLDSFASGITKLTLLGILQEFQKCIKEIALTTSLDMKEGKNIRKLAVGEVLEILQAGKTDGDNPLARLRCRSLSDLKEGWATPKGNQGTVFLERSSKPYYCCELESSLQAGLVSSSSEVRKLQPGEVLEVLEGPKEEALPEIKRLRGKAVQDGKSGWVSIEDAQGNACLELAKLLVCKSSIALTTTFDIAAGKAIRKLEAGEALQLLEGPQEDSVRSLSRVRVMAKKDAKEGWVTVKGNQGTSYAEEADDMYVCIKAIPLESKFASDSAALRDLEVGEIFKALEKEAKVEKRAGVSRVRGRNLSDGTEGWFTLTSKNFQAWSPQYTCSQSTVLNDALEIKEAKTLRKLEPGEVLEALDTPVHAPASGLMRVRVRAAKDGLVGYATVRGNQGTVLLKTVLQEGTEEIRKPAQPSQPPPARPAVPTQKKQ
mmetsp:Transcript_22477/g.40102  ORF Transcript_22477/g.40102 Transcript_22477/m.40102 type:complete len:2032 (-) Transcript_22477:157-6252(-)